MNQRQREQLRKRCVKLAKDKAKELAGYVCEHCGRSKKQGWQIHGSHIYSEGTFKSMSADVDNILALCARCHNFAGKGEPSWHEDPIYFADWFRGKYPERDEILKLRSRLSPTCDEIYWTNKLKELTNG